MRVLKPRVKILLTFIVPAVLAAIIIVLFLHYKLFNSAIERWGPENKFLIHTLEKHLEHDIEASVRALVSTSKQPAFSSLSYLDQIDPQINGIPENIFLSIRYMFPPILP